MREVIVNLKEITNKSSLNIILFNIEFTLHCKNIYTIIGKNGEGKSTLIKAMTGLHDHSQFDVTGKVLYDNIDLFSLSANEMSKLRQKNIQYLFQDPVNSFDPLKKIGYYFNNPLFCNDEIKEAFNYFMLPSLERVFQLYPYELSGGMAQRIAFILAVLKKPDLLILDEPTSGIDTDTVQLISDYLKEYISLGERTAIIVTQDLKLARDLGGKIALIADKRISEFMNFQEFITNNRDKNAQLFINAYNFLYNE